MLQKYEIIKDNQGKQLIIREFAELDKQTLSLLCEEKYESSAIQSAISRGKESLLAALRTKNMYPPSIYAEQIAADVVDLYQSEDKESVERVFNDLDLLTKDHQPIKAAEEEEPEAGDIDELMEDDFDEGFEEESLDKVDSSIKIADDDYDEPENDS